MSDDIYMERGKSQVLFNYLPNNTFDYTGEKGIHKVVKVETIPHTESNQSYIIEQVKNRVSAWKGGSGYGAVGYPKFEEDYQLVRPREVKTTLFPLLFECSSCDQIHTYDDTDELDRYNRNLECKSCNGTIQQRQLVFLHECGEIKTPQPYQCNQCGSWDDWELETYGSQRFRNTEWSCDNCGNTKDFEARCDCDLESRNMTPYVHRASSAFQPQHISVIDIGSDIDTDPNRLSFSKAVVARYLGLTDQEIPDIQLEEKNTSEERENLEWQLDQYKDMYEKSESEDIKEQIEDIESQLEEMGEAAGPVGEQVESFVPGLTVDETDEDDELPRLIQQGVFDAYQFHSVDSKLDRTPAREVIETAGEDTRAARKRREERAENVREDMEEMGIEEVAFIENFPITNAVFGYTRIENDPDNSRLIAFSPSSVSSSNEGTPIFADTVETEAVQFNLDPRKVLRWLLENSTPGPEPSGTLRQAIVQSDLPEDRQIPHPDDWDFDTRDLWLDDTQLEPGETESLEAWDESDIRAWIISNMGQVPELEEIPMDSEDEEIIAYMLYHLVHSFAHLSLKQVAQLSGMSRTSIAEYLLPRSLSFVIYSNQRTDYNIGGMYTLVESSLDDLLTGVNQRGNDCVYDPVCSREGASCHNCLYISEVSCTHLNRNLGRDFTFGSKPIADRDITGYLELDYDE